MRRKINLGFFGGGGSTTTTQVKKRDEMTDQQKALNNQVYGLLNGISNRYGGQTVAGYTVPTTTTGTTTTGITGTTGTTGTSNALGSVVSTNLDNADRASATAQANLQSLLDNNGQLNTQAQQAALQAADYAQNGQEYKLASDYLTQHSDLLNNGTNAGLQNYLKSVNNTLNTDFNTKASSAIANMAARGIVNSSTANKGVADLETATSKAMAQAYQDAFSEYANQYLSGSKQASDTATSRLSGLTDTAKSLSDLYSTNLDAVSKYASLPSTLYENALSPLASVYDAWNEDMDRYYGHEDYDTVVSQSGGK